jgi:xylulokinase
VSDTGARAAITVDLGTTGLKVGIVTLRGQVLWAEHSPITTTRLPDGGAEQDAVQWWSDVVAAVQRGLASGACPADDVVAVAVTGQWASTVPVDAAGEPVGPVLLWMDTRARRLVRRRFGGKAAGYRPRVALEYVRRSGGAPALDGADPTGHRLWLRAERPEVYGAARSLLEPVDYLTMRFTGVAAASAASMIASWLCDTRDPAVCTYDPVLVDLAGADTGKLPPLHRFGTVVGPIAGKVAAELGLRDDVQVVTGSPDVHSSALGSGAIGDYEAHMAVSTTSWISCPVAAKKTDVLRSIATVPGITPDRYLIANTQETAGRSLQWLRETLFSGQEFDALTALAAQSPPGAREVTFTPWLDGERSPVADRRLRGGFHGLSLATTDADLVRAVLEGVALNARWLLGATERFAGRRLTPIRAIGGGAQSDVWCQILADVLDRTIEQVDQPIYAGLRGAALLAGLALGDVSREEVRALVPVAATFAPAREHRKVYDAAAKRFPKLAKAQRQLRR